ncbi:MAG: hypothetical protein RJA29_1540 [Pseudomonadota bacterium]
MPRRRTCSEVVEIYMHPPSKILLSGQFRQQQFLGFCGFMVEGFQRLLCISPFTACPNPITAIA